MLFFGFVMSACFDARLGLLPLLLTSVTATACDRQTPRVSEMDSAPREARSAAPTAEAPGASTPATATASNSPPKARNVKGAAIGATGQRTSGAVEVVAKCKSPPPVACTSDADCTTFDIATSDGNCASTLRAGITLSKRDDYLASRSCDVPQSPLSKCIVHWTRAEDGPPTPPTGSEIVARCIKGACLSQYFARAD